jgi:hypothetical protein
MSNFDELFRAYLEDREDKDIEKVDDDFQQYRTRIDKEGNPQIVGENLKYNIENQFNLKGRKVFDLYNAMKSAKDNVPLMEFFDWIESLITNRGIKYSKNVECERTALVWIHFMRKEIERLANLKDK